MGWRNGEPGGAGFVREQVLWGDSRIHWWVDVVERVEVVGEWVHRWLAGVNWWVQELDAR